VKESGQKKILNMNEEMRLENEEQLNEKWKQLNDARIVLF
jgi:hypothetical protein